MFKSILRFLLPGLFPPPGSRYSILFDLETMDTKPSAAVFEIGAIVFDRKKLRIVERLFIPVSLEKQQQYGRTQSESTIAFHIKQKTTPKVDHGIAYRAAAQQFHHWITAYNPAHVWIWGSDFDRPIIESVFADVEKELPWRFSKTRDARTLWSCAFPGESHSPRPHNALTDAELSFDDLCDAFLQLNIKPAAR